MFHDPTQFPNWVPHYHQQKRKLIFICLITNNFMNSLGVVWAGGLVGVPELKKKKFYYIEFNAMLMIGETKLKFKE